MMLGLRGVLISYLKIEIQVCNYNKFHNGRCNEFYF